MKHGKNGDKTALVVQKTKILLVVIPEIRRIVSFSEIKNSFWWRNLTECELTYLACLVAYCTKLRLVSSPRICAEPKVPRPAILLTTSPVLKHEN